MRRRPGLSLVAAVALALAVAIGAAGCSMGGCPAALASGTLTAEGDELVLRAETGEIMHVKWPTGYGPATGPDGELVLAHVLGGMIARQGETVSVGGGMSSDDTVFHGCGNVWVSEEPPA